MTTRSTETEIVNENIVVNDDISGPFAVIEEAQANISVKQLEQFETTLGYLLFSVKQLDEKINVLTQKLNL
jgi:hypothetical protein